MSNTSMSVAPIQLMIPDEKIQGMPTFEQQLKLDAMQKITVAAKLSQSDKTDQSEQVVVGPTYLQDMGEALVATAKSNKTVANMIKTIQFYANLKTSLYKALSSITSFADYEDFLNSANFYNSKLDPCVDIREFIEMSLSAISQFKNSAGYQDANATQRQNMEQTELSVLQNYGNSLNNSAQQDMVFVKKMRNDSQSEVQSFGGVGDFLSNTCSGYASLAGESSGS